MLGSVKMSCYGETCRNSYQSPFVIKEAERMDTGVLHTLYPEGEQNSEQVDLIPHTLNHAHNISRSRLIQYVDK